MRTGHRSTTSDYVAALRALYTQGPPALATADDPAAALLLSPTWRALLGLARLPGAGRLAHRLVGTLTGGLSYSIPLRLGFLDDAVRQSAREGTRQLEEDPPRGVEGGVNGVVGALVKNPGTRAEEPLNAIVTGVPIRAGDLFRIVAPNGGGFGDPLKRDPWRVREDVLDGFATLEQAREVYGVALSDALELDLDATRARREAMARAGDGVPAGD